MAENNYNAASTIQQLTCPDSNCFCKAIYENGNRRVHCPAHDDPNASLLIFKIGAGFTGHCANACSVNQLIAAFEARGLYPSENGHEADFKLSNPPKPGGKLESKKIIIIPSKEIQPYEDDGEQGVLEPIIPPAPSLVLLSGETSAGKTVLAYNLGHALAEGVEIAGVKPTHPVRVLYFDLESPEPVHRGLVDAIGRSENLAFVRVLPNSLSTIEGQAQFLQAGQNIGLTS